ncbi:MAG: PAS domain-containing sensor histidine kinase [Clostridia bacterium]|nr:PAS domain-containing sensor histidine kinase [Clostridia bacterium]
MSKKIFTSICIVTLIVLFLALGIITGTLYSHFSSEHLEQLKNETELTARGVTIGGLTYLQDLDTAGFRITWITSDGAVLYDSGSDSNATESHMETEEIKAALENGTGSSRRYSSNLSEIQLVSAKKLPNSTLLKLSVTHASVFQLMLRFLLPMLAIIVIAFFASFILASRLSKRIMDPINNIDLDEPLKYSGNPAFAEIVPLLKRLDEQQAQIKSDKEELEKTSIIRQEFTANASHELKTPLHVISGYAELIENGMADGENVHEFAGKIRSESQRMSKLVEDIIDLSRLDSGGEDMVRETCDLYKIANNAVESLAPEADEAGITVLVKNGAPVLIEGIPNVLYSIVYNLASNAIKYNHKGGRVTVSVDDLDDAARLTVQDTGIGISPEDRSRIFERFYRVDKSRSKAVGGTGLGLSIVKHGAKVHNATIDVDSEPGIGSSFTVTFPKQ